MEMMLWNVVLSAVVAVMGFLLKGKFDELQRMGILLNRTREEVARDHITRAEFRADMQQLLDRFDRLERKIDSIRGAACDKE
jgi:Tfp pilus assembly protein PilN